ncbi:MAG: hypothetical protein H6765_11060 [Candidatus Peribacteria bacterium]|nr:MAG: hypothetical protein H6765_11060 [Candidatus Peribacteria bacterium]
MQHSSVFEMLTHATQAQRNIHAKSDLLRTYTLIELNNIQVKRSDLYMRLALYDLGLQPRNNWVDFSNMFMYLTGQPIHFFDAAKVAGDITIRQAQEGETFVDLFQKEHKLLSTDIVIADSRSVLAL